LALAPIACDIASVDYFDVSGAFVERQWATPGREDSLEKYLQALVDNQHQHPMRDAGLHGGLASSTRLSDILSDGTVRKRFLASELYDKFYRPLNVERQMVVALRTAPPTVIAMNRKGRDFDESEIRFLDSLRSSLVDAIEKAALRNRVDLLESALEAADVPLIEVALDGRICDASDTALRLLKRFVGGECAGSKYLPKDLIEWMQSRTHHFDVSKVRQPRDIVTFNRSGGQFTLQFIPRGRRAMLLFEQFDVCASSLEIAEHEAARLGLTPTQLTITQSFIDGCKSNAAIAKECGMKVRTVEKHFERILEKLGVVNRTAVLQALRSRLAMLRMMEWSRELHRSTFGIIVRSGNRTHAQLGDTHVRCDLYEHARQARLTRATVGQPGT
jgi:DNA-binding CsgD family transcriptional regulator